MKISWSAIFICLAVGICLAHYRAWLFLLTLLLIIVLGMSLCSKRRPSLAWIVGFIFIGLLLYQVAAPLPLGSLPEQTGVQINGRVDSIPYFDGQKTVFVIESESESPYQHKIRVVCLFPVDFTRGDRLNLEGMLKPPRSPGNPGEFDFPTYLANQGIYYNLTVKDPAQARNVQKASGVIRWVDSLRSRAEKFTRTELPSQEASVLLGMLWGGRAGMDDQQYEDFQKTGIVHLFSVGGLHVGFLLVLVNWLAGLTGSKNKGKFVAGVTSLIVYGAMVGWPPPVIRAVLMGILGLLAYLSGRENGLLNALAISGSAILLFDPMQLFNLSFQLTMLATAGLVYIFPCLRSCLPGRGLIKDIILVPICAEMAILPLVAYHFNLFTPSSILTNIATTYLSGAAVILGFLASIFSIWLPLIASIFIYPAGMSIELILRLVDWVAKMPGAYIWVASPSPILVGLYYAALALLLYSLRLHSSRFCIPAAGLLLIWLIILFLPPGIYNRGEMEIIFIDVGQGDAVLIKSPRGRFILVDGGGSQLFDVGAKRLLPYLHHRGIRKLDLVISTHPDVDHVQGLVEVIEEMPVKSLGISSSLAKDEDYQPLREAARYNKVPCLFLEAGKSIQIDDKLDIKVLHPQPDSDGLDNNRDSVVISIDFKQFSVLLTGDVSAAVLSDLAAYVPHPVTLIKIPHHGSKGSLSPEFYQSMQPKYAVISVGADNPFGHPHPLVLESLAEERVKVLRTDRDGAVTVNSNGLDISVNSQRLVSR